MRTFITACLVAIAIAIGAAIVLNGIVQQSSSTAYSTKGVRS